MIGLLTKASLLGLLAINPVQAGQVQSQAEHWSLNQTHCDITTFVNGPWHPLQAMIVFLEQQNLTVIPRNHPDGSGTFDISVIIPAETYIRLQASHIAFVDGSKSLYIAPRTSYPACKHPTYAQNLKIWGEDSEDDGSLVGEFSWRTTGGVSSTTHVDGRGPTTSTAVTVSDLDGRDPQIDLSSLFNEPHHPHYVSTVAAPTTEAGH